MGMNTACIIRNDFLHEIEKDKDIGRKIREAVNSATHPDRAPYHGQGFDVLPSCHADYTQVITIGGNLIRRLGPGGNYRNNDIDILRNLAASMGYRIVKLKERQ
jgi:hypothetical protein